MELLPSQYKSPPPYISRPSPPPALDTWPLNILEDGYVLYYKDGSEPLAELSDQQRREISARETARLQARSTLASASSAAAAAAPRRERGLKIHVDIQPAAVD